MTRPKGLQITSGMLQISAAKHHDPFAVLGRHVSGTGQERLPEYNITVYLPGCMGVPEIETEQGFKALEQIPDSDFYLFRQTPQTPLPEHYQLRWQASEQGVIQRHDPYTFAPQLSDYDLYLFNEGRHWDIYRLLGARPLVLDGIAGVLFATWAPGAERVSVVGDFNQWDGRCHPMRSRGASGVWELFIPGLSAGDLYKFEIRSRPHGNILTKTDPYARQFELRPATASVVDASLDHYPWSDSEWMEARKRWDWSHSPLSVYELHLGLLASG